MLRFMGSQRVGNDWVTELNCLDIPGGLCSSEHTVFNSYSNFIKWGILLFTFYKQGNRGRKSLESWITHWMWTATHPVFLTVRLLNMTYCLFWFSRKWDLLLFFFLLHPVSKQAKVKNKTPPVMSEMSGHLQKWSSKNSSPWKWGTWVVRPSCTYRNADLSVLLLPVHWGKCILMGEGEHPSRGWSPGEIKKQGGFHRE